MQEEITPIILSEEQQDAVRGIINKDIHILMGSAGTGKSLVIAAVEKELGDKCLIVTPTYANEVALHRKGVKRINIVKGLLKNRLVQNKLFDKGVTHIIVDEAGMLTRKSMILINEFVAKNAAGTIHVTYVGDPNQLDAISENHKLLDYDWFAVAKADFVLTKGFRQSDDLTMKTVTSFPVNPDAITIVMTNANRERINLETHQAKHGKAAFTSRKKAVLQIRPGDTLIRYSNLHNNKRYLNNCTYVVKKVENFTSKDDGECFKVTFTCSRESVLIPKMMFRVRNYEEGTDEKRDWELAYAVTCHSAQGSGYDNVIVYLEAEESKSGNDYVIEYGLPDINIHKWLYTAITRAIDSVTIVDPVGAIAAHNLSLAMDIHQSFDAPVAEEVQTPTPTIPAFEDVAVIEETTDDDFDFMEAFASLGKPRVIPDFAPSIRPVKPALDYDPERIADEFDPVGAYTEYGMPKMRYAGFR